jgi:AraC-like DNA-binding protein
MAGNAEAGMWALDPLVHAAPVRALLAQPDAHGAQVLDARVQAAQQFIAQALGDPGLTLAQVAARAHLSPGRLSHLFKSTIGVTVRQYIVWCRMKHAIHRLLIEDANLTQAAHAAGFHDSAHFSKHFKALFGLRPSTVYHNSRIVQAPLPGQA